MSHVYIMCLHYNKLLKPVTDEQVFYDKFSMTSCQVHVSICNIFYMTSFHMTSFTLLV